MRWREWLLIGLFAIAGPAQSQTVQLLLPGQGTTGCTQDIGLGIICARPGGMVINDLGSVPNFVCGKGRCVSTFDGYQCASQPMGNAIVDLGNARCSGGCERPRFDYCDRSLR
jgi:hypothetical protein